MSGRFSVNAQTTAEGTTLAHASERRVGLRPAARSGSHPQPAAELLEAIANADKRGVLRETVVERGSNAPSLLVHRVPCRGEGRQPQPRADRRPSRPGDTAPRCRAVPEPRLGAEPVGELLHAPEVVDVTVRVSLYRPTAMVPSGPPSISTSRHAPRPGATPRARPRPPEALPAPRPGDGRSRGCGTAPPARRHGLRCSHAHAPWTGPRPCATPHAAHGECQRIRSPARLRWSE
jgi:hypothetical protein